MHYPVKPRSFLFLFHAGKIGKDGSEKANSTHATPIGKRTRIMGLFLSSERPTSRSSWRAIDPFQLVLTRIFFGCYLPKV